MDRGPLVQPDRLRPRAVDAVDRPHRPVPGGFRRHVRGRLRLDDEGVPGPGDRDAR